MTPEVDGVGRTYWTGPFDDPRRFRIDGVFGELLEYAHGGEGAVFLARRQKSTTAPQVALKLLANVSIGDYERIHERCLAISQVAHPNIMRQEETFVGAAFWSDSPPSEEDFDVIFCVAQWIDGYSLQEAVASPDLKQKISWVCQIARATQYLHDFRSPLAPNGIIHRDIKPSNVRIDQNGKAVLIDFGMSRPNHGSELTGGAGTFLWMAPESIGAAPKTGTHSDVWGVGALAHWVVTGIPPRLDDSTSIRRERIEEKCLELGRRRSKHMARLVASLLETSPQQRPVDLSRWASETQRILLKSERRSRYSKWPFRTISRRARIAIAAVSFVLAGSAASLSLHNFNSDASGSGENKVAAASLHIYKIVIPGSSSGSVSEYQGPSTRNRVTGTLSDGATIYIVCQTSGTEVGYPEYTVVWDLLNTGNYVSDFFTNTPTPYNFSQNIPRCAS